MQTPQETLFSSLSYPAAWTCSGTTNMKHAFSGILLACRHSSVAFTVLGSFCVPLRTYCLKCDESLSFQTWETIIYYSSAQVHQIHFTFPKQEEYSTLWMNAALWASRLCCQSCFWSAPCPIVSMVSFSSSSRLQRGRDLFTAMTLQSLT